MIFGLSYWIWIWYGILLLGVLGLVAAIQWARQTGWRNLDEVLRAAGTILASIGMLVLLEYLFPPMPAIGYGFLGLALVCFGAAFILGRRSRASEGSPPEEGPPKPPSDG